MDKLEKLRKELKEARKFIKTDSYSMSIGEIINLYRDKELILNPAFQRLFRWNDEQKTKFIESILIGIPIPQIFVAQQAGGIWSIVDGVQRISTLLQLTGNLDYKEPLILHAVTSEVKTHIQICKLILKRFVAMGTCLAVDYNAGDRSCWFHNSTTACNDLVVSHLTFRKF